MQGRFRISVAMCTFNGADFLRAQLESILGQSRPPDEVVICDDGSTDGTVELARGLLDGWHGTKRIVRNDRRLGYIKNFEKAIQLTAGDIIFLSDQDDFWFERRIEAMVAPFLRDAQVGLAYCDAELTDGVLRPTGRTVFGCRPERHLTAKRSARQLTGKHDIGIVGCTMAFRSALKDVTLPIPPSWGHDHWIAFLSHAVTDVEPLNEPLMYYRRHPRNSGYDPGLDGGPGGWSAKAGAILRTPGATPSEAFGLGVLRKAARGVVSRAREGFSSPTYTQVIEHWAAMVERLQEAKCDGWSSPNQERLNEFIGECERRLRFCRMRKEFRDGPRIERLSPVLRSVVKGDYHLYVRGFRSAFKDLFLK